MAVCATPDPLGGVEPVTVTLSDEVAKALENGLPVVALESTLITHGLPRPHNLEVARAAEQIVRAGGAVPATIAVIEGEVRLGLSDEQLELLAQLTDSATKLSVRDLGPATTRKQTGGTTIAATARIAHDNGIHVLATGGLGGVHLDARDTWDVSADLVALRDIPIVVICSGVKSILDVESTFEYLETLSVTVASYQSDSIPGFYVKATGVPAPWRFDSPEEIAAAYLSAMGLGLSSALVVANPPERALEAEEHDAILQDALKAASAKGIKGKEVTPFLLAEMSARSDGRTLSVNVDLVVRNAGLAARVAGALEIGLRPGRR